MEGERSLPPGQGSKGHEGHMVDGKVPRKGSATAPFIGLHEMVRGLGGRNAHLVDGCWESEVSCEWLTGDTVSWLRRLQCHEEPTPEGMQRGRAAGPLAKMCGTTTHILRSALSGDRLVLPPSEAPALLHAISGITRP